MLGWTDAAATAAAADAAASAAFLANAESGILPKDESCRLLLVVDCTGREGDLSRAADAAPADKANGMRGITE